MSAHKRLTWLTAIGLSVLAGVSPSSWGAERLTVRVDEPFEVGGQLFPAGQLSVREIGAYSPVTTLNEWSIDGRCQGLLLARVDAETPGKAFRNELVFARGPHGHLVLVQVSREGQPVRALQPLTSADASRPVRGDAIAALVRVAK